MKSSLYISSKPRFSNPIAKWAFSIIGAIVGRTVVVYFKKRTSGEMRRMVCYWTDNQITKRAWDPTEKNLLQVWDIEKGAYRFISMDAVEKIVAGGNAHAFDAHPEGDPVEPACDFVSIRAELHGLFY